MRVSCRLAGVNVSDEVVMVAKGGLVWTISEGIGERQDGTIQDRF